ncbi:hypothetical protein BGW80DRAFT_288241 [Lactifluus volemus]|nr:hypothetical protein BGW80DRAFT_288241 [Lactifluus volemus]
MVPIISKGRCTFHLQTAPLGPGHPARPSHDTSNSSLPPLAALQSGPNPCPLSDPPFVGKNGPGLHSTAISQTPVAAANPLYANHQFTFPPPLQASASYDNSLDYSARHRAQEHLLSRTSVIPSDGAPPLLAIYQDMQVPHDHSTVARYAQSYNLCGDPQDYPVPPSPIGVDYGHNIDNSPCHTRTIIRDTPMDTITTLLR